MESRVSTVLSLKSYMRSNDISLQKVKLTTPTEMARAAAEKDDIADKS